MSEIIVIKIGGGIVLDKAALKTTVSAVGHLASHKQVVIVHGGGPQATDMAKRMGHTPKIVNGRRVTSDLDLELVLSTVCGTVNSQLVAALSSSSVRAVGDDGCVIRDGPRDEAPAVDDRR